MRRKGWTNNGHIEIVDLKVGDHVDYVDVAPKSCPVRYGPSHWNVLVVNPNSEAATVERLKDISVRTYWPKVYKWVPTKELLANKQKKMVKVPRPMFPGYLFVDLRRGLDDFRAPLNVKGVRDYLWSDDQPCILPNQLYDAIVYRENERSQKADEERVSPFKVGQTVRIIDGSFRDFVGEVEALDDRGRVKALMDVFARKTAIWLEPTQLEKV